MSDGNSNLLKMYCYGCDKFLLPSHFTTKKSIKTCICDACVKEKKAAEEKANVDRKLHKYCFGCKTMVFKTDLINRRCKQCPTLTTAYAPNTKRNSIKYKENKDKKKETGVKRAKTIECICGMHYLNKKCVDCGQFEVVGRDYLYFADTHKRDYCNTLWQITKTYSECQEFLPKYETVCIVCHLTRNRNNNNNNKKEKKEDKEQETPGAVIKREITEAAKLERKECATCKLKVNTSNSFLFNFIHLKNSHDDSKEKKDNKHPKKIISIPTLIKNINYSKDHLINEITRCNLLCCICEEKQKQPPPSVFTDEERKRAQQLFQMKHRQKKMAQEMKEKKEKAALATTTITTNNHENKQDNKHDDKKNQSLINHIKHKLDKFAQRKTVLIEASIGRKRKLEELEIQVKEKQKKKEIEYKKWSQDLKKMDEDLQMAQKQIEELQKKEAECVQQQQKLVADELAFTGIDVYHNNK